MKNFPEEKISAAAQGLRAIAHELRLAVLCHLSQGPMSVSELLEVTGATQSNLSQHLAKMRLMGLLTCERQSQQVYYRLAHPGYVRIIDALKSIYCPEACDQPRQRRSIKEPTS